MKNIKAFILPLILISSLVLSGCTSTSQYFYAYERGDCLTNRFDEVDSDLDLRAEWKYDTLYLRWDQYSGSEFFGYYIVRETSETCPYYYNGKSGYLEYISRKSQTYFKDTDIVSGETYYYRICVKETDKDINCGAVEKIQIY